MAYYLKWPVDTGNAATNNKLCQLSGIATTGVVNVAITFAENAVMPVTNSYLFDSRRGLDVNWDAGVFSYLARFGSTTETSGTSNYKLNGVLSNVSAWLTALADQTFSFDTIATNDGVISIGARFNQAEHFSQFAVKTIVITDINGTHTVDMSASGGTSTQFTSTDGLVTLKLFGFTGVSHWVFYADANTPFTGTINKGTLAVNNKQLSVSAGNILNSNKSNISLSNKQLSIRSGLVLTANKSTTTLNTKQLSNRLGLSLGVNKGNLTLNNKQESVNAGYVNVLSKLGISLQLKQLTVVAGTAIPFTGTLNKSNITLNNKLLSLSVSALSTINKRTLPLSTKQLSVTSGTSIPFTGTLNKSSLSINTKQLGVVGGFNSSVNKQSLVVNGKQENVLAGYVNGVSLAHLAIQYKLLSLTSGTSIPFIGNMSKSNLSAVGKPLSVEAGTVIPFVGVINKTSLSLSGKQLNTIRGQLLDIQKRTLVLNGKLLTIGEIIYPTVPFRRIFTMSSESNIFIMRR